MLGRDGRPAVFAAFDVLHLGGRSTRAALTASVVSCSATSCRARAGRHGGSRDH
jgi:hypothetical protein